MVSGPFSALTSSPPAATVSPALLMVSPQIQRLPLPLPAAGGTNRRISPRTSGELLPNHAAGLRAEHLAGPSLQVHLLQRLGLLHLFRLTGDPITITEKPRKSVYPQPSQPGRSRQVCLPCQPGLHVGHSGVQPLSQSSAYLLITAVPRLCPPTFCGQKQPLAQTKTAQAVRRAVFNIYLFPIPQYTPYGILPRFAHRALSRAVPPG